MGSFFKRFFQDFYRHAIVADYDDNRTVISAAFEGGVSKSSPKEIRTMKKSSLWAERIWLMFTCVLFGIPMILMPLAWKVFIDTSPSYLIIIACIFWLFSVYKFGMLSGLLRWSFKKPTANKRR